jgi:hypothetical protein
MTILTMEPARTPGAGPFRPPIWTAPRGPVVLYCCAGAQDLPGHEIATKVAIAKAVAKLMGRPYGGDFIAGEAYGDLPYFVPTDTLVTTPLVEDLGIRSERHLFGGVVPLPFMATKVIAHPLPDADSTAPEGWSPGFAQQVAEVVLPGYSAFSRQDALRAGERLLACGPVRIKEPLGVGGRGQSVARDRRELAAVVNALAGHELAQHGLVLECNLADVRTFSVGQACIGELRISYCGTQRLTRANDGTQVYGGSELLVARGDWDDLLALDLAPQTRTAIAQARIFHEAALANFDGLFASRCNYDVAQGFDDAGTGISGVLEQSWRIGGATAAELAALQSFKDDPALRSVRASTTEVYGEHPTLPDNAVINFQGVDDRAGPITKYSCLHPYADS